MSQIIAKPTRSEADYITDRLQYKMNVYEILAKRNRNIYWITSCLSMLCAAIVPVLINLDCCVNHNLWATGLSLLVTILVGIQSIFRPRELWCNYDLICANLRNEEMHYSTQSGEYATVTSDTNRFQLLVKRVESLISNEREETIIMRTSEKENTAK